MLFLAYRMSKSFLKGVLMEIKAKFWIENKGEVVLGGGKTALLLAVDRLGSIQRAADQFGMSYRHAWGVIRKIEQRAGFKIVETKLGGKRWRRSPTDKGGKGLHQEDRFSFKRSSCDCGEEI